MYLFYFTFVCLHVCAYAFKFKVHCGSAFGLGASGLPYYCTPPVCIPAVIGGLAVWWHKNKIKTKIPPADSPTSELFLLPPHTTAPPPPTPPHPHPYHLITAPYHLEFKTSHPNSHPHPTLATRVHTRRRTHGPSKSRTKTTLSQRVSTSTAVEMVSAVHARLKHMRGRQVRARVTRPGGGCQTTPARGNEGKRRPL